MYRLVTSRNRKKTVNAYVGWVNMQPGSWQVGFGGPETADFRIFCGTRVLFHADVPSRRTERNSDLFGIFLPFVCYSICPAEPLLTARCVGCIAELPRPGCIGAIKEFRNRACALTEASSAILVRCKSFYRSFPSRFDYSTSAVLNEDGSRSPCSLSVAPYRFHSQCNKATCDIFS